MARQHRRCQPALAANSYGGGGGNDGGGGEQQWPPTELVASGAAEYLGDVDSSGGGRGSGGVINTFDTAKDVKQ